MRTNASRSGFGASATPLAAEAHGDESLVTLLDGNPDAPTRRALRLALRGESSAGTFWADRSAPGSTGSDLVLLRGIVARDRLRWPEFDAALAEIETFPRSSGLRAFAVFLRAHAALARGARRRSLHEVEQLLQDGPPDMPVRDLFERLRIQLLVSLGDLAGATAVAANAGAIGAVETARLLLAEGRFVAAAETVAASPGLGVGLPA